MRKKILVIDDDKDIIDVLVSRLRAGGYDTLTAEDGREGLGLLKTERPDLVIVDIMMPHMDGVTFIHEVRKLEDIGGIPIVVLTAKEMMSGVLKIDGINTCLQKPFDSKKLMSIIKKYLNDL